MATVETYVEVDVELDDFSTEDLLEEVAGRIKHGSTCERDVNRFFEELSFHWFRRRDGIPSEVLRPLRDYLAQPVVGPDQLQAWEQSVARAAI